METIQQLVDRLGRQLERGVGIEDHRFRHITHSAHQGDADWVRRDAILSRETPKAARDWFTTFGIDEATNWLRIPANPAMGIEARLCVPVRFAGQILGHLWIIEREPIPPKDLQAVVRVADSAGVLLYRARMLRQVEQGLEREGVRDLLDESPAVRRQAAAHLIEADLFRADTSICALICTNADTHRLFDDAYRTGLDATLHKVRTTLERRDLLYLIRPDHVVALLAIERQGQRRADVLEIAGRMRTRLEEIGTAGPATRTIVAVGSAKPSLDAARESYDEALRTVQIARAFPGMGQIVSWDDLGVYRILSQVAKSGVDRRTLHDGVIRLLEGVHAQDRLRLLEVYLDRGGDTAATVAELGVHRASVYARLGKIEETMGVSLRDGLDRLAVHMSVKLIRLMDSGLTSRTTAGSGGSAPTAPLPRAL